MKSNKKKSSKLLLSYSNIERELKEWSSVLQRTMRSALRKDAFELSDGQPVNKGFVGTSLPLLPNIRRADVKIGSLDFYLKLFGVSKRVGGTITLSGGPNRRANRYLRVQYMRMITAIFGVIRRTLEGRAYIYWGVMLRGADLKNNRLDRKEVNKAVTRYWGIGLQLMRHSIAFRTAVMLKVLGRSTRWFHRDKAIAQIFAINRSYNKIVGRFLQTIPVRRSWISSDFKWRPLGIAPLAWRIYARGFANILETFLANGWPKDQHAYTTGRGVGTAWQAIMKDAHKAKFVYEVDFKGFFNSVRLEAVGRYLHKFCLPKFLVLHMLNLCSSDIENIPPPELLTHILGDHPLSGKDSGWKEAWTKYEFVHKFRKGWRSVGLAQGFSLSPILAVLPLLVLEELKELGIHNIFYADDGIFYSDIEIDFVKVAQELLDRRGIGAVFSLPKCKWIKKNGEWVSSLRFVGLTYDPFEDVLMASTRSGADLKLCIDVVGLFSDKSKKHLVCDELLCNISSNRYDFSICDPGSGLEASDHVMLDMGYIYRNFLKWVGVSLFPNTDRGERVYGHWKQMWDGRAEFGSSVSLDRLSRVLARLMDCRLDWLHNRSGKAPSEVGSVMRDHLFWTPLWALNNLHPLGTRTICSYEVVDLRFNYRKWVEDCIESKWDVSLDAMYAAREGYYSERVEHLKARSASKGLGPQLVLDNLVQHEILELTEYSKRRLGLTPMLLNSLRFGEWHPLAVNCEVNMALPAIIQSGMGPDVRAAVTRVGWHNLIRSDVFNTFVARLFSNTFDAGKVEQDFSLSRDPYSLTYLINRYVRRDVLSKILNLEGSPLNVFNSSTLASHLLIRLTKSWNIAQKQKVVRTIREGIYEGLYDKLRARRSDPDCIWTGETPDGLSREESDAIWNYPLCPYETGGASALHIKHAARLSARLQAEGKMDIETVLRSVYSEHEFRSKIYGNELGHGFDKVNWYTQAPYTKGPRAKRVRPRSSGIRNPRIISQHWRYSFQGDIGPPQTF